MGRRGIKGLKARVGRECCISREGGPDWIVKVCKLEESEKEVTVLHPEKAGTQQRGQLQK